MVYAVEEVEVPGGRDPSGRTTEISEWELDGKG